MAFRTLGSCETSRTASEGDFTSRMVNVFELIKGLHHIIGPAGGLITAVDADVGFIVCFIYL